MTEEPIFEVVDRDALFEADKDYAYEVDFQEAREAQELHAILRDLDFVMETADYLADLLREWASLEEDLSPAATIRKDLVERSLWTAALVAYARCYAHGTRYQLSEQYFLEEYPEGNLLELHRYFKNIRDKHVAHSVSPFESFATGAELVQESSGDLRVERLMHVHITHGHEAAESVETLGNLAGYVRGFVERKYSEAARKAWEKAEGLSQGQLRRLRPLQLDPRRDPRTVRPPRARPGRSPD